MTGKGEKQTNSSAGRLAAKLLQKSIDINNLNLVLEKQVRPFPDKNECVLAVKYSGINLSDVGGAMGVFPLAVWPRIPGRDYSGIIIDGPKDLVGKEVFGSGGELGIRRDGTHAAFLKLPVNAICEKPTSLSFSEAAGIGVPFITAYQSMKRANSLKDADTVVVFGANGKVSQAFIQMATHRGVKIISVERSSDIYSGHSNGMVTVINASKKDMVKAVKELTDGRGVDIVFNTVGGSYFEPANLMLAQKGTQIFIADRERKPVSFDIRNFYRGEHTYVGIDTQHTDIMEAAEILRQLKPDFESGRLKPFKVVEEYVFPLENIKEAYKTVWTGAREKVLLKM